MIFKKLQLSAIYYNINILPVVLYGCETWSLTLGEECGLRVFENRILSPRGMRMRSGEGSQNEELHSLYRSPNLVRVIKSKRMRWAGHIVRMEEGKNVFNILTGNLQETDL